MKFSSYRKVNEYKKKIALVEGKRRVRNLYLTKKFSCAYLSSNEWIFFLIYRNEM